MSHVESHVQPRAEANVASELHGLIRELYPICRSITGDGVRDTLRRIQQRLPLVIHEVPSGTQVFDWVVPREWNIWELQHLVRERPDDDHHEEWAALIASLRDFARVDGTLPGEFDQLVRDSFGELLAEDGARTEATATP